MTEAERKLLLLVAEQVSMLLGKQVELADLAEEVETKEGRE